MNYPPSGCGGPGEWTAYHSGDSYRGYTLSAGSLFLIHLRDTGGRIYYSFNGHSIVTSEALATVMQQSEAEIVRRVRDMLPAYKIIRSRVEAAQNLKDANVTVLRPRKE